jgi:hypothetical protein
MKIQLLMIVIDFDQFSIPRWKAESSRIHPIFVELRALDSEYLPLAVASELWLPQLAAVLCWIILLDFVEYFPCSGYQVILSIQAAVQLPRPLLIFGLIAVYSPPRSQVAS